MKILPSYNPSRTINGGKYMFTTYMPHIYKHCFSESWNLNYYISRNYLESSSWNNNHTSSYSWGGI